MIHTVVPLSDYEIQIEIWLQQQQKSKQANKKSMETWYFPTSASWFCPIKYLEYAEMTLLLDRTSEYYYVIMWFHL